MHHRPAASRDLESSLPQAETTIGVPELDGFVQQGLITEIHTQLMSGKEATVYCCRAHPSMGRKFVAAKVYREHAARSIRRGLYFEGRERNMKARELRAVATGSEYGHRVMAGLWMSAEYDYLKRLFAAGASVPRPLAMCGRAIVMEYLGNGAGPAPHLHGVTLDVATADRYFRYVVDDIETMLSQNLVHGDLSPYNILVWNDRPWIIDLPQAVDVRFNRNALELLQRDVANVCGFFAERGVDCDRHQLVMDLWSRYQRGSL